MTNDENDLGGDERPQRSGEPSPVDGNQLSHVGSGSTDAALRRAFDAGWNATKYVICNQSTEENIRSMREQQEQAFAAFMDGAR